MLVVLRHGLPRACRNRAGKTGRDSGGNISIVKNETLNQPVGGPCETEYVAHLESTLKINHQSILLALIVVVSSTKLPCLAYV
jgi:hypothetical protein